MLIRNPLFYAAYVLAKPNLLAVQISVYVRIASLGGGGLRPVSRLHPNAAEQGA